MGAIFERKNVREELSGEKIWRRSKMKRYIVHSETKPNLLK